MKHFTFFIDLHLQRCRRTALLQRRDGSGGVGPGSGEAEGAGGGGQGADRGGEPVEGGVRERKEEEEEEEDTQQVGAENREALGVLQSRADGGKTHVVTEGVTENRTHQMTCNTDTESEPLVLDICLYLGV